ncbi:MAG: hypothetical protein ACQXXF_08105 [Thermoplasmatota archaeon]|jgi:hypothetical protein
MKTYVEVYVSSNGEKASIITEKLLELGLKPTIGEHDFVYTWKEDVVLNEVLKFVDNIQSSLKNSGAMLKFSTFR